MTDMERPASPEGTNLQELRERVTELYATEAEPNPWFTYVRESNGEIISIATLSLEEAIIICGARIESAGIEKVLATIDDMRGYASSLETADPELFEMSKAMGQEILKKYKR